MKVYAFAAIVACFCTAAQAVPLRQSDQIFNVSGGTPYTFEFRNLPAHDNYPGLAIDRSVLGGQLTFVWTLDNIPNGAFVPVQFTIGNLYQTTYWETTPHPWSFDGLFTRYWFEHTITLDYDAVQAIASAGLLNVTISSVGIADPTYSQPKFEHPPFYPQTYPNSIHATLIYNQSIPDELPTGFALGAALFGLAFLAHRRRRPTPLG